MNATLVRLIGLSLLILVPACSPSPGPSAATGVQRNGIKATAITTEFDYGEGINAAIGIPSGAKAYRTENRERVGPPALLASDATFVDEPVDGTEARLIRVSFSLRDTAGNEVAKLVAFFKPFADESYIVKTILDDRYESIYKWGEIPGHSLVYVTTVDQTTGTTVLETKNLEFIQGSQGLFRGEEHHFAGGKVVCISAFVRHMGTGLLVDEQVRQGALPKDYHAYEFVLCGWPSGRSPGFGSGFGGGMF